MARFHRSTGPKASDDPVGRVKVYDRIYLGTVKDNRDVQKMGRLKVWIPEMGGAPSEASSWVTVSYASPFAGATDPTAIGNNQRIDTQSQTSYGWWAAPPDLENQVLVFFINGDPSRGVWFACLYQQNMNHMVPGVAAREENFTSNGRALPVTEYNKRTTERPHDGMQRPESTTQAQGIIDQGLIDDPVRGITNASVRRESPSQVYGLLTPGPLRQGSNNKRTGGSSFYMDDSDGQEHVRIRTKSGAQILLDETNGLIYAINKPGTSWIQMDAEGNVDVFGAKSFSVRAQEDINLRADRDVNIEAGRDLNIKAAKDYKGSTDGSVLGEGEGQGGKIRIRAMADSHFLSEGTIYFTSNTGALEAKVQGRASIQSTGPLNLTSANIDLDSSGNLRVSGNAIASGQMFASDFQTPTIGLNAHTHISASPGNPTSSSTPGTGGTSSASGPGANEATNIRQRPKTNTLKGFSSRYIREQESVRTTVTRFTTFEPCAEHTAQGDPYEFNVVSGLLAAAGRAALSDDDLDLSIINTFDEDGRTPGDVVDQDLSPASRTAPISVVTCENIQSVDYNLRLSPNFTLGQLSTSALWPHPIRGQHGLTDLEIVCNLRNLCINVLEPIWAKYPNFNINSGFRTFTGSRSQHERGQAVDIQWRSIRGAEYLKRAQWIRDNISFDQLLFEHGNSIWIHLSFDTTKRQQRYQVSTMVNNRFEPGLRLYYT